MDFSLILPFLVSAVGLYLLIKLRFFYIRHPIKTTRDFAVALSDRDARRSFCLALAGTLGVGNIFGVAAGIMIGGAGSLFWLFVSALLAMIIKYAETLLTFDCRVAKGGMADVLKKTFLKTGKFLAPLYAALTLVLSLFIGSAMQSTAVLDVAENSFLIHPITGAFILIILLLPCLVGGARKIENITEIVIPVTTIIYILMCFYVILLNFSRLGDVINMIISSASNFKSAIGGGVSLIAVREGFARGILSNEAGAGTSAMAHSTSQRRTPHIAGLFAMSEVVFDSLILCMLTGITILLSVNNTSDYKSPMSLVSAAFSNALGSFSVYVLLLLVFAFAYSTLICWYFYGRECALIYFPKIKPIYPFIFVAFIIVGRFMESEFMLYITDFLLLTMTILTLSAILRKVNRIAEISFEGQRKNPE
jgi:AGCS family alanine or glycine:cation symporter